MKNQKRLLFITIIGSAIFLVIFFWSISVPENKANRILESMMLDYERIENLFYTGFIDLGEGDVFIGESEYYLIQDEYETLNDLEELLDRVYTNDMARKILSRSTEGDAPIIIEREGRLYRKDAYEPGFPFEMPIEAATKINNDEIRVEAASANNENFIICINLIKKGGQWKIKEITEQER